MESVYHDPRAPGSVGGVQRLRKYAGKQVADYLVGQDAYTFHKPIRKRFVRRRSYSKGIGDL